MTTQGPLSVDRPERVAVVIPAKNEAERIEATVRSAGTIEGVDLVVVVDDGSTDATSAVAMGAGAVVVRHKSNRGKAAALATGAQMVALREGAERADGGEDFSEELHAEPREPGHTGPLPVIDGAPTPPRALLFLDADMGDSAAQAAPLAEAVLTQGVDMAIALLPPQEGASGLGIVVRTARRGIERATGWTATQPLSGTRCLTRETWDACQPLAPGWGVETSLTIDALTHGFWVKEIEADLHHRATGRDLRGQLHRAAQLRDVLRALARRRHVLPDPELEERTEPAAPEIDPPIDPVEPADPVERAYTARGRREALAILPVAGDFTDDDTRALGDVDVPALAEGLAALPVAGPFEPDDIVYLAGVDLGLLAERLREAPVEGPFDPAQVVIIASHLEAPEPDLSALELPLAPDEYASLVVHAAVDAENEGTPPDEHRA